MTRPRHARRPRLPTALAALAATALLAVAPVAAQPTATAKPTATAVAAPAGSGSAAMPPGHPPTGAMPPGHPPAGDMPPGHPPADNMPPGHPPAGQGSQRPGFFRPRQDAVLVSEQLPPGTIDALIVDADERPLAGAPVTLAILRSSVTKGESRDQRQQLANEQGRVIFRDLPVGSGISYTVNTQRGEAGFASQPFGLKHDHGVKVLLHAYEPVTQLASSMMVMEAILVLDIREDSIAVNHLVRGLNLGRTAYVAGDVLMRLPEGYKAFNHQEGAGGVAMVDKDGSAQLTGTFPPGQAELTYRYQVPLTGDPSQTVKLPLPPRVAQTTVMVSAGKGMGLSVAGFPVAQPGRRRDGQRVLQTAKQVDPSGGIQQFLASTDPGSVEITISGIPTPGPARWIAVLLGLAAIAGGLVYYKEARNRGDGRLAPDERQDLEQAQDALLGEMALLERARTSGEVGPRSYERLRAALLDALARIVSRLDADAAQVNRRGGPFRKWAYPGAPASHHAPAAPAEGLTEGEQTGGKRRRKRKRSTEGSAAEAPAKARRRRRKRKTATS